MSFVIGASATEVWFLEAYLEYGDAASGVPDIKFGWNTLPASSTIKWGASSTNSGNQNSVPAYASRDAGSNPVGWLTAASTMLSAVFTTTAGQLGIIGKVFGGGTTGTVQLQAAQNVSDAAQVTVKAGSILRATKVKA
jgi:hypothetical protein